VGIAETRISQGIPARKIATTERENEFKNLSDLKSAFGKVAIDALFVSSMASNRRKTHQRLLAIHKDFSWANQIVDDLQDVEEDIAKEIRIRATTAAGIIQRNVFFMQV